MPMLEVSGLRVAYDGLEAVRGVELPVEEGKACAVLGSNGAGKTTLLRGITGFGKWETGRVTGGQVLLDGKDVTACGAGALVRHGVRLIPERQNVFLPLSVAENLRIAEASGHHSEGIAGAREMVETLFPILTERQHQKAGLLSGGERQMLALATGLLSRPRLLIIDEASIGLAPVVVRRIFDALIEIKRRLAITLLLVEQNVDAALRVADVVYVLRNGEIVAHGAVDDMSKESIYAAMTGEEQLQGIAAQ
jgi:branched-chain amino acid transport system ATP-binding protein